MKTPSGILGAGLIDLNHPAHYFIWGWLQISLPNLIVVLAVIGLFLWAVFAPYGRKGGDK